MAKRNNRTYSLPKFEDGLKEERFAKYLTEGEHLYQGVKFLTYDVYRALKAQIEAGDEDAKLKLVENCLYDVVVSVSELYSKYDITEVISFEEGLNLGVDHFNRVVLGNPKLPNSVSAFINQFIQLYTYRSICSIYSSKVVKQHHTTELMNDASITYEIDKRDSEFLPDSVYSEDFEKCLNRATKKLRPREKEFLFLRYGYGTDSPKSANEIAQMYNLTVGRVNQILKDAICKVRENKNTTRLKDYMDHSI